MVEGWQRSTAELLAELRDVESRRRRDYGLIVDLTAELESRTAHSDVGYPNLPELLRDVSRISTREAKRRIQHAHALTETSRLSGGTVPAALPATAAALRAGVLGPDHVHVVASALTALPLHVEPAAIADAERTLVTAAASMDARTLARVGARVRAMLDQDGTPPSDAELANPVNELHLMTRSNGRTAFRGEFEPETSTLFRALLSPLAGPRPSAADGPDQRTPAERNGDALADLLQLAAASADLPAEAGERPHLLVTVPLRSLRESFATHSNYSDSSWPAASSPEESAAAGLAGPAWLAAGRGAGSGSGRQVPAWLGGELDGGELDGGELDAASARRLACDAKIIPAVLGAASEPLDLGRASYTVSAALRRALVLRDGGCAFPGCFRPPGWCHSHHVRHWADGGTTSLDNLVLLCGHHHRLIHHSPWDCTIRQGHAEFRPPHFVDPERTPRRTYPHISGAAQPSRLATVARSAPRST